MKTKILLDTGIISGLVTKNPLREIKHLMTQMSNEGDLQGYVTKPILLEVAKHLSFLYPRDKVTIIIFSFLRSLEIKVIEPEINTFIRAGRLQYSNLNILSACDALTISLALNKSENYTIYTTDRKMIEESSNIKNAVKYKIFRYS